MCLGPIRSGLQTFPFSAIGQMFWPYEMHPEGPWTDNIHEDFAHILAELQHGLQLLEQDGKLQALRYWRDSYFFHWGHHASAAVWAIEWNRNRDANGEAASGIGARMQDRIKGKARLTYEQEQDRMGSQRRGGPVGHGESCARR